MHCNLGWVWACCQGYIFTPRLVQMLVSGEAARESRRRRRAESISMFERRTENQWNKARWTGEMKKPPGCILWATLACVIAGEMLIPKTFPPTYNDFTLSSLLIDVKIIERLPCWTVLDCFALWSEISRPFFSGVGGNRRFTALTSVRFSHRPSWIT